MSKKQKKYGKGKARPRGRIGGRPPILSKNQAKRMVKMYHDGNVEIDEICKVFWISKPTLYRYLRESK